MMKASIKWFVLTMMLLLMVSSTALQVAAQTDTVLYRVNVGGPLITATDASGVDWGQDQGTFPGTSNSPYLAANSGGGSIYTATSGGAHPGPIVVSPDIQTNYPNVPVEVFETERYDAGSDPEMLWQFPITPGTEIELRLFFAELFGQIDQPGERVFDVSVEGSVPLELDDIDPFAIAGAKGAVVRTTTLVVTDGTLDVEFIHVTENPALKGIEIIELTPPTNAAPVVTITAPADGAIFNEGDEITFTGTASDTEDGDISGSIAWESDVDGVLGAGASVATSNLSAGVHTITASVTDSGGLPGAASISITVVGAPDPVGTVLYRINVGGPQLPAADASTPDWAIDTNASPSPFRTIDVGTVGGGNIYNGNNTSAHPGPIVMTDPSLLLAPAAPDALFNIERWDPPSGEPMVWQFPVNPGTTVELRLFFAELFSGTDLPGERVFDVSVEGVVPPAFDDIDQIAANGPKGAFVRFYLVTVNDGTLDIQFNHVVENPALKGIEIVVADTQSNNTPVVLITSAETDNPLVATANDAEDGDLSSTIQWSSDLDGLLTTTGSSLDVSTLSVGTHVITASVTDTSGTSDSDTITVTVQDSEPPVITLVGDNPLELTVGDAYVEPGATATDNVDGDISGNIVIDSSAVDTNTVGSYAVTYNVSDAAGNAATEVTRTVNVTAAADTEPPVITLVGDNPLELTVGDAYVEPGATATDNVDGDISGNIVIDSSAVDTNTVGSYAVTYNVSDAAGNAATEVTRTVNVNAPEPLADFCINIGGTAYTAFGRSFLADNASGTGSPFFTTGGQKFGSPTATVTENIITLANVGLTGDEVNIFQTERFGGAPANPAMVLDLGANSNLTGITTSGALPNGDYLVDLYFAEIFVGVQSSGASKGVGGRIFDVTLEGTLVLDDLDLFTVPEPDRPLTAMVFTYPATVSDNTLTVEFAASVDNAKISAICVSPNDGSDTTAPAITLLGDNPLELTVGDTYVEPGAEATDDLSTDAILRAVPDATAVDTGIAGSYSVIYTATDAAGNSAQETRTVNVNAANTAPVIDPIADVTVTEGTPISVTVVVTDTEGDATVSIEIVDDATTLAVDPASYSFINNELTWTNAPVGSYTATVTADDGEFNTSESFAIVVNAANTAPVIDPIADVTVTEGTPISVTVVVTDTEGDATVSIEIIDNATTLAVDPASYSFINNELTWTNAPVGSYAATVTADDGEFNTSESFAIVVEPLIVGVPQAFVAIDPSGNNIDGSTFDSGFIVTNQSTEGLQITSISVDLSSAMYPNMVFDPNGTAGDAAGKCFTPTSASATATGLVVPTDPCADPFSVPFGNGGAYVLSASFTDFNPGETFSFSVDVDPTSIENASSTGSSGSVSGLELTGSVYTVTFSDGSTLSGEIYRVQPDSLDGAANTLKPDPLSAAPGLTILGTTPATNGEYQDATITSLSQTAQVSGPVGASVSLLVIESDYLVGTPSSDPFEANIAQVVSEYDAVIGAGGTVDIPVTLTDSATGSLYYLAAVVVEPDGRTSDLSTVWRLLYQPGTPIALIEINPGGGLGASTFSNSSYQITNNSQGGTQITSVSINLATGNLPDMVFDPVGSGGDATSNCFTPNSGASETGVVVPLDPCVDPFSQPRNGGFDILTVDFTDFDPGEQFFFTTDIDPNSIQGVSGAGNAGAVSGYELVGATVTVTFSNGVVLNSSLYEDGSLGGSQAVVAEGAPAAPSIQALGITSPAIVNDLNQTIVVTGVPGQYFSLLQMDTRLYIASGDPPFNVSPSELPFYANEAMSGKNVFNGVFDADGVVEMPLTLLQTAGATGTPDGGLNYFVAVSSNTPYAVDQQVSQTSNVVILKYEEVVQNNPPQIAFLTNVGSGISVDEGGITAVQFTVTDPDGNLDTVEVTGANFITLTDAGNGVYTATFEPVIGDAGNYTITVTATDTETASSSQAFSLTVNAADVAMLTGTFTLQGRATYDVDLAINLYPLGSTTPAYTFAVTAQANGEFMIDNIAVGTYQIAVKHAQSLQVVEVVPLSQGANTFNFGELRMGDVNGDNLVSALDFSLLAGSYNAAAGDANYNPDADLNGDNVVDALDFSLLASNYNVAGEIPQP